MPGGLLIPNAGRDDRVWPSLTTHPEGSPPVQHHPIRGDELTHVFREWRAFAQHHGGLAQEVPSDEVRPAIAAELPRPLPHFNQQPRPEDLPPTEPNWLEAAGDESTSGGRKPLCESSSKAALFVSDLHLGDGTVADDFLEGHLTHGPDGQVIGCSVPGPSKAGLFARVVTFAVDRLQGLLVESPLDIVLNGDIIDYLELNGRRTHLSPIHFGFFGTLATARAMGDSVVYLRGNHDYLVPPGPWTRAHAYANTTLRIYAEHGDRHDPMNWPPGLWNIGSMIVRLVRAPMELTPGGILAGVDNVLGPLRRLEVLSPALSTLLGGAVHDQATLAGALLVRTTPRYLNWLIVQGHSHVPLAVPGAYYNTGTWIPMLASAPGAPGEELLFEAPPFLLVYSHPQTGERVEEFYTVDLSSPASPRVVQRDRAGVNALRRMIRWNPI